MAFPGIETLGNLDPSPLGPRIPVGPVDFVIGSLVNFCLVGPSLSQPCAHLHLGGLAEIEGTEAHGLTGGQNPHTSPKLCHLDIPVQWRSQEFIHAFIYSLVHCLRTYCVLAIVLSVLSALSALPCSWAYTSTSQMRNSSEESSDLPKITQPGLEGGATESSSVNPPERH